LIGIGLFPTINPIEQDSKGYEYPCARPHFKAVLPHISGVNSHAQYTGNQDQK
jgi:hypothetical protein